MQPSEIFKTDMYLEFAARYGEIMGGSHLRKALGFSSTAAFCKALERNTLDLAVFYVAGRRGRFALTIDVVEWLLAKRAATGSNTKKVVPTQFQTIQAKGKKCINTPN